MRAFYTYMNGAEHLYILHLDLCWMINGTIAKVSTSKGCPDGSDRVPSLAAHDYSAPKTLKS